ncbi:MAG: alpha/beta fold hydrolase [Candidatus Rokubacteria bacterium]|nr:alpha/beta fold hydrolase [Candidatus Rokubacteria bacterium]
MPKLRVSDITLHYVEAGAGEPLVLIMGFGGDHTAWAFQIRPLAERYRVIAFDNRGAGQSDAPDLPYTTRMMAEDTAALLRALGVDRAHVVGVSMGGMIAQELALGRPELVRSLHLGCSLARPDAHMRALNAAWRDMRTGLGREPMLRALGPWLFGPRTYAERPKLIDAITQNTLESQYPQSLTGFLRQSEAVVGHDTLSRLGAIRCPTLVSVAEDDILVPPRFSRELAAAIPGAELRVVADAGHLYFLEQPDVFNALCMDFLARVA